MLIVTSLLLMALKIRVPTRRIIGWTTEPMIAEFMSSLCVYRLITVRASVAIGIVYVKRFSRPMRSPFASSDFRENRCAIRIPLTVCSRGKLPLRRRPVCGINVRDEDVRHLVPFLRLACLLNEKCIPRFPQRHCILHWVFISPLQQKYECYHFCTLGIKPRES